MSFTLRPYQAEAVEACLSGIKNLPKTAAILPTGAGKTEIMIAISDRFLKETRGTVLILSHLDILTEQTTKRFMSRAPHLRTEIMQAGTYPNYNADVVVSTMQSSRIERHIDRLKAKLLREVKLIIVDEAHFIPTESYETILNYFPETKVFGCTATPFRNRALMTSYFDQVSYSISLQELINQGFLIPPTLHQILKKEKNVESVMAQILTIYKTQDMGSQAIVFMKTISDAKTLRNSFLEIGIPARAVTSELTGEARQSVLNSFSTGETKVLTTVDVLTAGFDSPAVQSIYMPYGTKSPTQYLQRIGRGLRPLPGKTECKIFVFGDAPSISNKLYQKVQNLALNHGGKPKPYETMTETLEYNSWDTSSEIYIWTKQVVDTIAQMQKLGMPIFSELLETRTFPKRYLKDIAKLAASLPKTKSSLPHGKQPATETQKQTLFQEGFSSSDVGKLNRAEAATMISTLYNMKNKAIPTAFTIPTGQHAGKHVSELPYAYRDVMKKKYPKSAIAQLIFKWEKNKP